MMKKAAITLVLTLVVGLPAGRSREPERRSGPLLHAAYVFQRSWTAATRTAVAGAGRDFSGLLVLAAEAVWDRDGYRATMIDYEVAALKAAGRPVGLVMRVGAYPRPERVDLETPRALAALASRVLTSARAAGLTPAELQIDFDCAEGRLAEYRAWLELIRLAVAGVPLTITVLPCWLGRADFPALLEAVDGFVLQVHAVEPPPDGARDFQLFDPARARAWIETAARLGRPFQAALPTYGYVAGLDRAGRLVDLWAEEAGPDWRPEITPPGIELLEVRADPEEVAELTAGFLGDRPAELRGLVWYRLPTPGDRRNWPLETLRAVMAGRAPAGSLRVWAERRGSGLIEVLAKNEGEADETLELAALLEWKGATLLAADGLRGFGVAQVGEGRAEIRRGPGRGDTIRPGERVMIGWLRFDRDPEAPIDARTSTK